jgi:LysR family transcriptional regulator, glycine cleavage system transcriptional activator
VNNIVANAVGVSTALHIARRSLLPSLHALIAFEMTAQYGSITRASTALHLSESAVSRLVRQVEETVQIPLFDRVKQRLILTEAGRSYAQSLRVLLIELERTTFQVMASGTATDILSIGVFSTFAMKWLIPILPAFQQLRPGVVVNCFIRSGPFDFNADPLDAAIHYGDPVWPGAIVEPLFGETLIPVASPRLPGLATIRTAGDLIGFPLLHEISRPTAWDEWFETQQVKNVGALQGARFDQFCLVACAAAAGLGIGLVPRFLVTEELSAKRLVIPLEIEIAGPYRYNLAYPQRSRGLRVFEDFKHLLLTKSSDHRANSTSGHCVMQTWANI